MEEKEILSPAKRELFDTIFLRHDHLSKIQQNGGLAGWHNAGTAIAIDGNNEYLKHVDAPKRLLSEEEIRAWADAFVLGYLARIKIERERELEKRQEKARLGEP